MIKLERIPPLPVYTWQGTVPAQSEVTITHSLGFIPSKRLITLHSGLGIVRDSTTAPDLNTWYLINVSSASSAVITVEFYQ